MENSLNKSAKKLNRANISEFDKYFYDDEETGETFECKQCKINYYFLYNEGTSSVTCNNDIKAEISNLENEKTKI